MRLATLACLPSLVFAGPVEAVPPRIVSQSGSMEVTAGDAFVAQVTAVGESLEYRWFHDGEPLDGESGATLLIERVGLAGGGDYQVVVSGPGGEVRSEPVILGVKAAASLGISAGERGIVAVPGRPAYYDLYLPSNYGARGGVSPVLFTFSPSGGGMVGHFRTVAEEKGWIVVGVSQSRNGQDFDDNLIYHRAVFEHALGHLKIDPNRIFVAGMSGGGWASFMAAKRHGPLVAGVFSMGGWLGREYSFERDIYLPGLLVARANGDSDTAANSWLSSDRNYLANWISSDGIRDWSFPGGHVPAPESVQREVFDWFISRTTPSTAAERDLAREQEALWKAGITAGEVTDSYRELVFTAFNLPRTPDSLAAWRTLDFLFSDDRRFLREPLTDFADFPGRNFFAVHLYHSLFDFMQRRDPSMQISAAAAARALGEGWTAVQSDPESEIANILRHPVHTPFDDFVLEHGLHDRPEAPRDGDWDGDGETNFEEVALGSDPLGAGAPSGHAVGIHSDGAYATLTGCRPGPMVRLAAEVGTDPGATAWTEVAADARWWMPRNDGTSALICRFGDPSRDARGFVRFTAAMGDGPWHDANGDGIPYEYQFPEYQLPDGGLGGDTVDLADARGETLVPGGAPQYLRYLTAAEIGPARLLEASFRWHPALAGYRGFLYHEVWMDVPGSTIGASEAAVLNRPPNEVRLIASSQAPWFNEGGSGLMGDFYFERTRGYIVPDVTGNHVFSISGDDECELWLSTDATPARATRIAHVAGWTAFQNFTQSANQTSVPIRMTAGRSYFVKILHKEGNGGDHCSVSWMPPGTSTRTLIPAANLRCPTLGLLGSGVE